MKGYGMRGEGEEEGKENEQWRRKRGRGKEGKIEEISNERERVWKVTFRNVAGVGNKDKEFWEGIEEWDVVILMETWLDGKGWERIRERL